MITQPASVYLALKGDNREAASRLVHLGRRRASDFIPPNSALPNLPVFNLLNTANLFRCLKDNEARIMLLRRVATRIPELSRELTILCCYYDQDSFLYSDNTHRPTASEMDQKGDYEEDSEMESERSMNEEQGDYSELGSEMEVDQSEPDEAAANKDAAIKRLIPTYTTVFPGLPAFFGDSSLFNQITNDASHHRWLPDQHFLLTPEEEHVHEYRPETFGGNKIVVISQEQRLEFLFGDTESMAIFAKRHETSSRYFINPPSILFDDIAWYLKSGLIAIERLERLVTNWDSPIYRTLLLLSVASTVYESLPEATVSVETLNRPFLDTHVDKSKVSSLDAFEICKFRPSSGEHISRSIAIGLVAYFEGGYDIDLVQLKDVMAISAGDSIYIPKKV
jgi:hypothetical protein